jgi:putative ABC transport system permease protein
MIKNYLKIALRSFRKYKAYGILNILGLTIGITSTLLISLYVYDELTYDHFHDKADQIFRLDGAYNLPNNGGVERYAAVGAVVGEMVTKDYPEAIQVVRLRRLSDVVIELPSSKDLLYETVFAADSNIFDLFTFQFLDGNPEDALLEPQSIVLTRAMAMKYFNRVDVVGEVLSFPDDTLNFKITGVVEDYPSNTHLKLDFITSFETLHTLGYDLSSWWSFGFYTYVELQKNADPDQLEQKIKYISRKYIPDQEDGSGYTQEYSLTKLKNIHLHSNLRSEMEPNSKAAYAYIFLIVGIFIILIACINFMNLTTARSAMRAKEVGVRKVSGAFRWQLIGQFLTESILMVFVSMAISVLLSLMLLPQLNSLTGKFLTFDVFGNPLFWVLLPGLGAIIGVMAGSYPSFFLSAIKPSKTLKGSFKTSRSGTLLRQSLVVFQFTISIVLITGTIIVYQHLSFLRSVNLGFEKGRTVILPTRFVANADRDFKVLKDELLRSTDVVAASLSARVPGKEMPNNVVRLGWDDEAEWSDMRYIAVDEDFVDMYQLELVAGRSFDKSFPSDVDEAFMLNESGMRRLGFDNPQEAIGKKLRWQDRNGYIIGIIRDFYFMSANVMVEPFIVVMNKPWSIGYLSLKLSAGDPAKILDRVHSKFAEILPNRVFEYYFLDDGFDQQYKAEDRFMRVFTFFAAIAVFIACLGLYGLAMFTAEQRFKEIGIRKVLGASASGLVMLQIKQFIQLVMVAFVVSVPIAYLAMNKWLEGFPVRENINPLIFLGSGTVSIIIAWVTVGYQSIKAANINPVDSIMHE